MAEARDRSPPALLYAGERYLARNPDYHVGDSAWKAEQVLRMLRRHAMNPARVYEVGCGAGEILYQLQARLPPAVMLEGWEISPAAHALCAARANERLRFHLKDLTREPVEPADVLLCMDVVEHVEDCFEFLRALREKAEHVILHIPLDLSLRSVLRPARLLNSREAVGHLHYFTWETALATVRDAGFEVVDSFYTCRTDRARGGNPLVGLSRRAAARVSPKWGARLVGGFSVLILARG